MNNKNIEMQSTHQMAEQSNTVIQNEYNTKTMNNNISAKIIIL